MSTIEDLKTILGNAKKCMETRAENATVMLQVVSLLEQWTQKPESFLPDPKVRAYFLDEFSQDLIHAIVRQSTCYNIEVPPSLIS
jgi:hypothetical protein